MNKKKSQMIGQVFIYILAVALVGFLLIFGYNSIVKFKEKMDDVSLVKFQNDIKNHINLIAKDYGSIKIVNLEVPPEIKTVCIVESHPSLVSLSGTGYPIMEDSVNSGVRDNVFLIDQNVKTSFDAGPISIHGDHICLRSVNSRIGLQLQGAGDHTIVSEKT